MARKKTTFETDKQTVLSDKPIYLLELQDKINKKHEKNMQDPVYRKSHMMDLSEN